MLYLLCEHYVVSGEPGGSLETAEGGGQLEKGEVKLAL